MAIQPDPPIQLDPSMDTGHQLAFINQNFQSIANTLNRNSFVIVQQGTTTIAGHTLTTGANQYGTNQTSAIVTHNLGYIPIILAYTTTGSSYSPLPDYAVLQSSTSGYSARFTDITVDVSVINFFLNTQGFNITSVMPGISIKYYLLQQTAN